MKSAFKVLFIYPNTMMATLVPISISILSACLKEKGIEVDLFDTTYYPTEEINFEMKKVELLQIKPFSYVEKGVGFIQTNMYDDLRKKVSDFQPDLVAITIVEDTYELALSLLHAIREVPVPVIAGGVFVTFCPEKVIAQEDVDIICLGEGEAALVDLCEAMASGSEVNRVPNLWVKSEGQVHRNPMRKLTDINSLPFIDYDVFDKKRLYRPMMGKIYTMVHVEVDRGCPYDCTYCEAPSLRKRFQREGCGTYYRRKRVDRVMTEMEHLVEKYKPDYVNFNSETFLARPLDELKGFANQYRRRIRLPFWCQTRPETVTEEKIRILKEMNCQNLQFGIEHGNEEFRSKMLNRHCSNERILEALHTVEKYGIAYTVNNIIGFPGETRELVFDTIRLNRQINPTTINCYMFTPYRGTRLYQYCVENGYLDPDAKVHQLLDGAPLKMDTISYQELKGLQRTFSLYAKMPESEFDQIRVAERFDEEGNRTFEELSRLYREKYF